MKDYNMKDITSTISKHSGLYGVFANTSFGTTTLSMQIAGSVVDISDGTAIVFSLELSKEQWHKRMLSIGLPLYSLTVIDEPLLTDQIIENTIKNISNTKLVVIDYLELLTSDTSQQLRSIAKKYSIPILVCGKLSRNSGDFDSDKRPDLISAYALHGARQLVCLQDFDFLALLHREHDCDRGIGTAHRYNISNTTELIIKVNRFGEIGSVFFHWNEQQNRFDI